MIKKPSPCYNNGNDCPDRSAGCHAECERYSKWKQETDSIKNKERAERMGEVYANEYIVNRDKMFHRWRKR